jgi:Na+-driven multidrug efflux pump
MSLQAPATAYLQVRSLAQPALLVSIVAQACLLAQQDSRSPALSVLLQVVVNASLDAALIVYAGAGVVGAAWATVAAQYLGMLLLLQRLHVTGRVHFRRQVASAVKRLAALWKVLAPLVVVYVARNLCYMLLQVSTPLPSLHPDTAFTSMYSPAERDTCVLVNSPVLGTCLPFSAITIPSTRLVLLG